MASSKPKPLSFSTTIRNPERIPSFLKCIAPYDGQCLTTETIHKVVKNVIAKKEYRPNYIKNNPSLNSIYKSSNQLFSDDQLEEIMSMAPQKHKEAGFKEGWDSRFDTWYKLIKEFGFIKYISKF